MGAPLFPRRSVGDAARDLALAADRLRDLRDHADGIVALLEERWAANRDHRSVPDNSDRSP